MLGRSCEYSEVVATKTTNPTNVLRVVLLEPTTLSLLRRSIMLRLQMVLHQPSNWKLHNFDLFLLLAGSSY
jgi:hypothetical protein